MACTKSGDGVSASGDCSVPMEQVSGVAFPGGALPPYEVAPCPPPSPHRNWRPEPPPRTCLQPGPPRAINGLVGLSAGVGVLAIAGGVSAVLVGKW